MRPKAGAVTTDAGATSGDDFGTAGRPEEPDPDEPAAERRRGGAAEN